MRTKLKLTYDEITKQVNQSKLNINTHCLIEFATIYAVGQTLMKEITCLFKENESKLTGILETTMRGFGANNNILQHMIRNVATAAIGF